MSGKKITKTEEITSVKGCADLAQSKGDAIATVLNNQNIKEMETKPTIQALELDYKIEHGIRNKESKTRSRKTTNTIAFLTFVKLCEAKYFLRIYPRIHLTTNEPYFWIFGVKKNSQAFDFKLLANPEIINVIMGYLSSGELIDITNIDPDNIEDFKTSITNFALALYRGEIKQGQKKIRHVSNKTYSKYDFGMISYDTKDNEEMREYISSTII